MPVDTIPFAQTLIRHPSITPEEAGVLDTLQGTLEGLGFSCERVTFSGDGSYAVDNLYARLGTGDPHLCYAGHVDVVPVGDFAAWDNDPFAADIKDGVLYGRGAEDMKGAIACFVTAISQFVEEAGTDFGGSVSLLITCDEEGDTINGTRKLVPWLKDRGEIPTHCLVGEPTNPQKLGEMIKIGRRGSVNCSLTVRGKQGHVAYPHMANNPVTILVNILFRLQSHPLDEGTEFFPPSNLEVTSIDVANQAHNVIPATATAKFNVRFNTEHSAKELEEWVRRECESVGGGAEYDLDIHITGEPFLTKPDEFTHMLADIVRDVTGITPDFTTTGGTSDARFIKDICPVIEFGTTGKTAHMVDECVAVDDLEKLTVIYNRLLKRYFAEAS